MAFARSYFFSFFFNDTATTEIYTLSLHDALPISPPGMRPPFEKPPPPKPPMRPPRSEEHTSELQSRPHLVCRLLLENKKHPPTPSSHPPTQPAAHTNTPLHTHP